MFLTMCTNCEHQRIRKNYDFDLSDCPNCDADGYGLIDYMWISDEAAQELVNEKGLEIEE